MVVKFGTLENRIKQRLTLIQLEFVRRRAGSPFLTTKGMKKFWKTENGILGHAVAQLVEALRYKSEGRGIDSRWCRWNFSLT